MRITRRDIVEATPFAVDEIQADKDHLRAQFAMSVRRLELSIEEMRAKTAGHSSDVSRQALEISRLQVDLDKKMALILAMRAREHIRKSMIRRVLKIIAFLFVRSSRQRQRELFEASLNRVTRRA